MALSSGVRLGPYEILAPVGAGGMGEVYHARDTRLDRDVAIKVLPADVSGDASRRERFKREARAVSALNHPHICALYDVGHQDGTDFLVMEYIEGETLAVRLDKGPLPLEQFLRCAIQIADALDKAHRQRVIHRDLKPGNIMLTKAGTKLLDFGLVKPVPGDAAAATLVTSPTAPRSLTAEGTIVGTFQYISPEQLEGKDADARSDIFAFGAVLYEMATGKKAFEGKSRASVIAAILEREPPPISSLQPMVPPALDRVVKACLAKDPDERWQSARDLASELQWIADSGSHASIAAPAAVTARRKLREPLAWALVAVLAALTLAFAVGYFRSPSTEAPTFRAFIAPPEKSAFHFMGLTGGPVALSPDGRRLAFVAASPESKNLLWVRALDSLTALPLPGTEGASFPFWSPDCRYIGFFANGKLKKIDASGGPAQTLANAPLGRGGTWNAKGVILFTPDVRAPILRVSAAGGVASAVTRFDADPSETTHRWPYFLPDGQHFLYLVLHPGGPGENDGIYLASLDLKVNKLLLNAVSNVAYASGYLLFVRDTTLLAQRFDAKTQQPSADAVPVAEELQYDALLWRGVFSVSENGILVYQGGGTALTGTQLLWVDRAGKPSGSLPELELFFTVRLSPNGQRLAVQITDRQSHNSDIWIYELSRGIRTRFTFGPARECNPVWSPDGSQIVFASNRKGHFDLYQKASSGAANEELLLESKDDKRPMSWSPDGRFLAYYSLDPKRATRGDIWILPLFGDKKPFAFLQSPFEEGNAQFSPDGRWIAYTSDESGKYEVYVAPFPGPGGKWQVSAGGGLFPMWRRDGKELFYLLPDNSSVVAAEVNTRGSTFEVGAVRPLFQRLLRRSLGTVYDVSSDGQRFLLNTFAAAEQNLGPVSLVTNWTAELKKK